MGGRGSAGGSFSSLPGTVSSEANRIRNFARETLRVYDKDGKLVYKEGGTGTHTGYSEVDYKDKIALHNHPDKKTGAWPSATDFDTFERKGLKEMVIASKDYIVRVRKDPSYIGSAREGINAAAYWMGERDFHAQMRQEYRSGKITRKQYNKGMLEFYKRAAKRAGYLLTY